MKKVAVLFGLLILFSCQNFGQLKILGDLPSDLKEVSGVEFVSSSNLIWVHNDGGNSSKLYLVSEKGKIIKVVDVKAKNHDWEDLTSDNKGNLYIGDFGNNRNRRKNLRILKVDQQYLTTNSAEVTKIEFSYPNQKKFPPKKKNRFFDTESFFYFKNNFYIFTKSRVKNKFGKTFLYKIPAQKGKHVAELIGEYDNCEDNDCWITSADISPNGDKVVLLSQQNILVFSNFRGDNFFSGDIKEIKLSYRSQKEGVCFKDNNTLLVTDEFARNSGGNLYELSIE
ncbi:hypothetical protein [uncultured Polaribacter sp.]|uniref:hypothetical protein n=1 Tax=uncultured Polaribacter sp. TaxID=174711 RepID=UPI002605644B|nr:hypothetical protein [uncultured Polaribacter sp.]